MNEVQDFLSQGSQWLPLITDGLISLLIGLVIFFYRTHVFVINDLLK